MRKLLIPLLIIAVFGFSKTAGPVPPNPGRSFQIKKHDINQVEMSISNYGKFGQTISGAAGGWWPKGSGHNYIFGAGPWFGTIDQTTGDTLVTIGYGPHGGETEYGPGLGGWSISDPNAVIFLYPANFPPPADKLPMAPQAPKSHQDSWCAYNDQDATYHMAGDTRPIGLEVYQTVYAWNLSSTQDIIFIRYEVKNVSGHQLTDCFFGVCTDNDIGNESGTGNDICSAIRNRVYHFPGETDSVVVNNLGYQWQLVDESGWIPAKPGTIGFDYLQSPFDLQENVDKDNDGIPDQHERDSSYYAQNVPDSLWDRNGNGVPGWRDPAEIPQFGLTAFKRFTLNLEPNRDNERYTTMAGFNFKTGAYEPFDTIAPSPDDQRFLQVSGPFSLEADSVTTVLVGIVFAKWYHVYGTPDSALAKIDGTCQFIYDMNWLLPGPPPPPTLTCVPGDHKVTLIWNNLSEITVDPYYNVVHFAPPSSPVYDPFYLPYDFQGYRVWKSLTGRVSDWALVSSYDLSDGITFIDSVNFADSIALNVQDNGVVHSFVDNDVRNGFNYYYAISAFDYNYVKKVVKIDSINNDTVPNPIWFESGKVGITAVPRREAANYLPAPTPFDTVILGNPMLDTLVSAFASYPVLIDSMKSLYLEILKPDTATVYGKLYDTLLEDSVRTKLDGVKYSAYLKDDQGTKFDSTTVLYRIGSGYKTVEFQALQGLSAQFLVGNEKFPGSVVAYDSIEITGIYPKDSIKLNLDINYPTPNPTFLYDRGFWAWRNNDYQIEWYAKTSGGPVNTIRVIDFFYGDTIPFKPFRNNDSTRIMGAGWCFTKYVNFVNVWSNASWPSTDTLVIWTTPAAPGSRSIYINGTMIWLNQGTRGITSALRPIDGEKWIVRANRDYRPASVCGNIKITAKPGIFLADKLKLNVKVVPNPYVVHNEWQQSSLIRRVRFINLPDVCTVRIYNLNGELIRTILHTVTIVPTSGQTVLNNAGGDEWWDLLSENRQLIASGVYIFHVDSKVGEQVGKFAVVR